MNEGASSVPDSWPPRSKVLNLILPISSSSESRELSGERETRTGMKSGLVNSQSSLLQHIEKRGLAGIIQTQEKELSALLIQT